MQWPHLKEIIYFLFQHEDDAINDTNDNKSTLDAEITETEAVTALSTIQDGRLAHFLHLASYIYLTRN